MESSRIYQISRGNHKDTLLLFSCVYRFFFSKTAFLRDENGIKGENGKDFETGKNKNLYKMKTRKLNSCYAFEIRFPTHQFILGTVIIFTDATCWILCKQGSVTVVRDFISLHFLHIIHESHFYFSERMQINIRRTANPTEHVAAGTRARRRVGRDFERKTARAASVHFHRSQTACSACGLVEWTFVCRFMVGLVTRILRASLPTVVARHSLPF